MRNLKKVLSLVLCVAMLLSVMVMGTGAVTLTDSEDISPQYREAAEVLTGMGIINGYEDDSFKPQQSITRAEVAAMIYRVATGDVEDEKADINAGAKIFTDVDPDDWYAGYVNYCGDAEYIKGFEDDSFRADENVTGYQVLAMILRAVGYDKNNEFTGTNWTINVASTAAEVGMLKNVDSSVNLSAEAPRELVAEFIFQAVRPVAEDSQTQLVHWSPAAGDYRPDNAWNPESLGEKVFDLDVNNSADEWGRPEVLWVYNTGDEETVIEIDPVATYTTAVAECDVADDVGLTKDTVFDTYTNGQTGKETIEVKAIKDNNIGAQGQLVEVYVYTDVDGNDQKCIVAIDTFLAQVTGVTEVKYDANNHVAKDASLTLTVYDGNDTEVTLTDDTNYTYAVGDMLLVNAYTVDADADAFVDNTTDGQYVEIVSAAESFVGAQTTIHYNADTHTINGTEYNDAYKFFRDDAGVTEDYNFTWYLDQYGNVIGATGITSNYAVLKDMIWVNGGRDGGYAEATLVYMDGTEATVTVDSIDEFNFTRDSWAGNNNEGTDTTPSLSDGRTGFGLVSTDSSLNGDYEGYAMYRVDTNSDGSVNLEGTERYSATDVLTIGYKDDVSLDVDASAILDTDVTGADRIVAHVSSLTKFLVNDNGTYTAYTGTANLGEYNDQTVEVFYHDEDGDDIADYVYIKTFSSVFGKYVFATKDAHSISTGTAGVSIEGVYVDGVETTILARPDVAQELLNNKGKLYEATWIDNEDTTSWRYGRLVDIELVNEASDEDNQPIGDEANYLEDTTNTKLVGSTLYVNSSLSYNVSNADQVIYTDTAYEMSLAEAIADGSYGIWVVGNQFNNTATVYVGTKLEQTNTITVTPAEGVADGALIPDADDPDGQNYTYTINDRNDDGKLDLVVKMDATSQYATMVVTETTKGASTVISPNTDGTVTLPNVAKGDTYKVTVTTECNGQCAEPARAEWTITIDGWNIISDAVDKVTYYQNNRFMEDLDVYYSYEDAVNAGKSITIDVDQYDAMRVYADPATIATKTPVMRLMTFSDSADALVTGVTEFLAEASNISSVQASGESAYHYAVNFDQTVNPFIVLGFTPQSEPGVTVYVAFNINMD